MILPKRGEHAARKPRDVRDGGDECLPPHAKLNEVIEAVFLRQDAHRFHPRLHLGFLIS